MDRSLRWAVLLLFSACISAQAVGQVRLSVDASEAPRRIIHSHLTFNVSPGALTLMYAQWIPGEHGPTGPVQNTAGLHIRAGGKELAWQRDLVNMYAIHIQVPPAVTQLEVDQDILGTTTDTAFLLGNSVTPMQLVIEWNQVLLYPEGANPNSVNYEVTLKLPSGWKFGTALPVASESGDSVQFRPVSLYTLVDSPLIAGAKFRHIDITPPGEPRKHYMEIAADSDAALDIPDDVINCYRRLVQETGVLFGARHYNEYHFLVTMHGTYQNGLEHHQSSDNRLPAMGMADARWRRIYASLMTHEMTHSWNGKYRRPEGLASPDFGVPMKDDLLWVYEGLTNYLGEVLAARAGLWTAEDFRDEFASLGDEQTHRPGRTWRPLEDTAVAAQELYGSSHEWENWRRTVDYYHEGSLIWLEVDTILRARSGGSKSMDDFCKAFFGGQSGPPAVVPYKFEDVVATLNKIVPYDWQSFFDQRIYRVAPHAPMAGVEASGWKLAYTAEPSQTEKDRGVMQHLYDMTASLGLTVEENGDIRDVLPDSPAAKAGVAPGMKLMAVNWYTFTPDLLRSTLRSSVRSKAPIELLTRNNDIFGSFKVDYHEGEKFPHLQRIEGTPDVMADIIRPHASHP